MIHLELIAGPGTSTLLINDHIEFKLWLEKMSTGFYLDYEFYDKKTYRREFKKEEINEYKSVQNTFQDVESFASVFDFNFDAMDAVIGKLEHMMHSYEFYEEYKSYHKLFNYIKVYVSKKYLMNERISLYKVLFKNEIFLAFSIRKNMIFGNVLDYIKVSEYHKIDTDKIQTYCGKQMQDNVDDLIEQKGNEVTDMILLSL